MSNQRAENHLDFPGDPQRLVICQACALQLQRRQERQSQASSRSPYQKIKDPPQPHSLQLHKLPFSFDERAEPGTHGGPCALASNQLASAWMLTLPASQLPYLQWEGMGSSTEGVPETQIPIPSLSDSLLSAFALTYTTLDTTGATVEQFR